MTDILWELAEHCWAKLPAARHKANAVCDVLSNELHIINVASLNKPINHPKSHASPIMASASANADDTRTVGMHGILETMRPVSIIWDDVQEVCWMPMMTVHFHC
jgi:hypothetical protein